MYHLLILVGIFCVVAGIFGVMSPRVKMSDTSQLPPTPSPQDSKPQSGDLRIVKLASGRFVIEMYRDYPHWQELKQGQMIFESASAAQAIIDEMREIVGKKEVVTTSEK